MAKGSTIDQVFRNIDVTEQTYYRWRPNYESLSVDQAKRLKELKKRNTRFFSFWFDFLDYLALALLSFSIDCFAGRHRTCHEIYDSIADLGEFWLTALVYYLAGPIPTIVGFMGVKQRSDRTKH